MRGYTLDNRFNFRRDGLPINAETAIEVYAQVFDEEGALDHLEAFASLNGPRFYGLPVNEATVRVLSTSESLDSTLPVHTPVASLLIEASAPVLVTSPL